MTRGRRRPMGILRCYLQNKYKNKLSALKRIEASRRNAISNRNARRASASTQSRGRGQPRRSHSLAGTEPLPPPYKASRHARAYHAGMRRYQRNPIDTEPEHSTSRNSRAAPTRVGNFPNAMGCNQWVPIDYPQDVGWGTYRAGELDAWHLGYKTQLGGRGARIEKFTRGTWSNAGHGAYFRHAGDGRYGTISQQSPMSFNRGTRWSLDGHQSRPTSYMPWLVFDDIRSPPTAPYLDMQQRANPAPPLYITLVVYHVDSKRSSYSGDLSADDEIIESLVRSATSKRRPVPRERRHNRISDKKTWNRTLDSKWPSKESNSPRSTADKQQR